MKITRKLKKTLLFALGFLADTYQAMSIRSFYRAFYWPGGYPYEPKSFSEAVSRMKRVGEIEKIEKNGQIYLKLTSKGEEIFSERISLKKLSERNWDGYWRLVVFDIEEIQRGIRDYFREKLRNWGFAMWQESIYISPHPILSKIDQYLKTKKLFPKVVTMQSKLVGIKNHDKFAWVVFKLGKLKNKYLALEKKVVKLLKNKKSKKDLFGLVDDYKDLIFNDPFLPKKLINDRDWPRERIEKKIKQLLNNNS